MRTDTLLVGGLRLGVRSWGTHGPPLVLLHSLGESAASWCGVAQPLAEQHRVYALDLRGHGASDWSPRYSLELLADDVAAALEAMALADVCLVGHSLGGMVGSLVASKSPPTLARLVLEEAPPPLPILPAREIPEHPGGDLGFDWTAVTDLYAERNNPDPSWWNDLASIQVPTLVIAGGADSHVDQAQLRLMAHRIPGAELVEIPAGHNVHGAHPEEFVQTVTAFLDS